MNNIIKKLSLLMLSLKVLSLTGGITVYHDHNQYKSIGYNNDNMHENGESNLLKETLRANDLVCDVGASIGEWSVFALSCNPSIDLHSFEPIPLAFSTLQKNLQSLPPASQYNIAISDTNDTKTFFYYGKSQRLSQLSGLYHRPIVDKIVGESPQKISVKSQTLDSFCVAHKINHINFLKIDTEGAEYAVLTGALSLLRNNAIDIIQFEYGGAYHDSNTTLKQIYTLLTQLGYHIFRIIPNGLLIIDDWNSDLENYLYSNYCAVSTKGLSRLLISQN